jgi:transcriptional regulator with XRE-family HTH domain
MQLRLREYRTARGLTQGDVARAVGVTTAAVGKWERGENQLKVGEAATIADLLSCSVDDLIGRGPRELAYEARQHEELERAWSVLNLDGRGKLLAHARLLALDANNTAAR